MKKYIALFIVLIAVFLAIVVVSPLFPYNNLEQEVFPEVSYENGRLRLAYFVYRLPRHDGWDSIPAAKFDLALGNNQPYGTGFIHFVHQSNWSYFSYGDDTDACWNPSRIPLIWRGSVLGISWNTTAGVDGEWAQACANYIHNGGKVESKYHYYLRGVVLGALLAWLVFAVLWYFKAAISIKEIVILNAVVIAAFLSAMGVELLYSGHVYTIVEEQVAGIVGGFLLISFAAALFQHRSKKKKAAS